MALEFPPLVAEINRGFCAYCHLQLAPPLNARLGAIDLVTPERAHVTLECADSPDGDHHVTRD